MPHKKYRKVRLREKEKEGKKEAEDWQILHRWLTPPKTSSRQSERNT